MTTELPNSTIAILRNYILTNNGEYLVQNIERLKISDEENRILQKISQILSEFNQMNIEGAQSLSDQIVNEIEDASLQGMLKLFTNHIILQLLDQIIEKAEQIEIRIETLLRKNQILEDVFQLTKEMQDEILVNKYCEVYLDNLIMLGLYALYSTNYKSVFQYLNRALELQKEKAIFPAKYAFILRILSCVILKLHNYPDLLKLGRESLKVKADKESYQISLKYLKSAAALDKAATNTPGLALDHYYLAMLYYERNLLDQALTDIKKAQTLHEELSYRENILNDIILSGLIMSKKEESEEAYQIYNQALHIATDLDLKYKIGELNLLIGNYLRAHQKYDDGLKYLKTALLIFKQENEGRDSDFIEVYNGLGVTLRELHKLEDAKEFLQKILAIEHKTESSAILMEIYSQLALTFIEMDDKDAFQESYDKILSIYQVQKDDFQYATHEYNLGISFCQKEQFQEGLAHLYKAFKVFYNSGDLTLIDQAMNAFSSVYSKSNKSELAQAIMDTSKDIKARAQIILEQGAVSTPKLTTPSKLSRLIKEVKEEVTAESTEETPSKLKPPPIPTRTCSQCGFLVTDAEYLFCPKCAATLDTTRTCKKCGFQVADPEFRYCPKCAQPLD